MTGSQPARPLRTGLLILAWLGATPLATAMAQPQAKPASEANPGQFFTIEEPINSEVLERIKASTKQLLSRSVSQRTAAPILVFEFRPGKAQPGSSGFGTSFELANFISTELGGAKLTVAYVPQPLKGYAVLPALACDELVMGPESSIGPITPEGEAVKVDYRETVKILARRKGKDQDLFVGLLDRDADLKLVRTADRQSRFFLPENLEAFRKTNPVAEEDITPAWKPGMRGILTASQAREEQVAKLKANDALELANVYRLPPGALASDPTLLQDPRAVWIAIEGRIDSGKEAYIRRRIDQARREGVNLIFFKINSLGGMSGPADNMAAVIADLKGIKTVAYIDDRAIGVTTLIALACDDIVFRRGAQLGKVQQLITGSGRRDVLDLSASQLDSLGRRAEGLASQKGHPSAVARAMVDREAQVMRAVNATTGASVLVLESTIAANPENYLNAIPVNEPGKALVVASSKAGEFGLGQEVEDDEAFKAIYGLRGKPIRVDGPTWVDGLVTTLNDPFVSLVLLFVGVFMLILEIKMPGVGLPAITSALAFLLFFWSRYLSGTADQLEILLFLVGLICLGLELFVFPGFGVFGMSGFLMIVVSIVMASHTFIWPTQEYEYRQMAGTLFQIVGVMVGVGVGVALFGKYMPSLPVFNRMVLKPELSDGSGLDDAGSRPPIEESYQSMAFLMGETGRTTTVLRPTGKARFGNLLIDVRADGYYIERDALIEVIDVQGMRVIVKPIQ